MPYNERLEKAVLPNIGEADGGGEESLLRVNSIHFVIPCLKSKCPN